jgi:N-acyl-D-amino-acid deacylase
MPCDFKLSGGRVIDGTGAPAFSADVAITGEAVTAVGDLDALEARETIACSGRIVAPGFIDIHSHADWLVPSADCGALVEPFVRQGMTTIVGGNCGFSPAPISERSREAAQSASRLIADEELALPWETMGEFLDGLEQTELPLNVAELVGHGAVRAAVTGPLTPDVPAESELDEMERLTKQALDAGCVGVSTGLGYAPGIFAKEPELTAFARWTADAGKLFTSHVRAYSWVSPIYQSDPEQTPHNILALQEVIRVARAARARLQLSHLIFVGRNTWHTAERAIEDIEAARAGGLDVAFDAFPYTAGNTTASVLFPPEMLPHLEAMLQSPDAMAGVRKLGGHFFDQIGFSLQDVQIMNANAPALDRYNGLFVADAAERAGMEIWEFYARLVIESQRNARVLNHTYSGDAGEESALRSVLAHSLCSVETDTMLTHDGHQNPASYGTFPRVLHTYVREGLFPLEEAVRKMTGAAAERLGWTNRGRIGAGCAADLVVFDPDRLRDSATFEQPAQFSTGIEHVFINGVPVVAEHRYLPNAAAGRLIRS